MKNHKKYFLCTDTTVSKTDTDYEFSIECDRSGTNHYLVVACYDSDGLMISYDIIEGHGGALYTASVPKNTDIKYAKVFLWLDSATTYYAENTPLGREETVQVN